MQYYLGWVVKPDQTKLGSTKPNISHTQPSRSGHSHETHFFSFFSSLSQITTTFFFLSSHHFIFFFFSLPLFLFSIAIFIWPSPTPPSIVRRDVPLPTLVSLFHDFFLSHLIISLFFSPSKIPRAWHGGKMGSSGELNTKATCTAIAMATFILFSRHAWVYSLISTQ